MSTNLNHLNRTNSLHKNQHQHHIQDIIIDNSNSADISNNNKNSLHNLHHFRDNRTSTDRMHKHHQDYKKHRLEIGERQHSFFFSVFYFNVICTYGKVSNIYI